MEIRSGIKKFGETEKKYVHMLNSTLCATGRAICCLLETYQEADGVRVPEVLVPFMGGITFLPFVRDSRNAPTIPPAVSNKKAPAAPAEATQKKAAAAPPAAAPAAPVPVANPAAAAPAPAAAPASGPEAELLNAIASVGDEVRQLKTAKAGKDVIKAKVDELLALKTKYQELTGQAPGAPGAPAAASAEKPKGDKAKAEKKEVKAKPQKKGLSPPFCLSSLSRRSCCL
jgi:pyruvate/2-oxoglutarate dehydrogenase complex dihydrolipoamide acyltransferase (E2) component